MPYQRELHRDGRGELWRARAIALEALLTQLKTSPLAFVRRQSMICLSAVVRADVSLVGSRCVIEAIAHGLHDDSGLVRFSAVDLASHLACSEFDSTARTPEHQVPIKSYF